MKHESESKKRNYTTRNVEDAGKLVFSTSQIVGPNPAHMIYVALTTHSTPCKVQSEQLVSEI
jgi:hypothetical protein